MLKTLVSACAFAVVALMTSSVANAQAIDRRTFFTFTQPVTLPGVTLPAGKYLFRILDTDSSRRVVQVLNAEGTRSYALLLSIPAQRLQAPSRPEIGFMETASTMPAAIRTWWYPGTTLGYEFIYPREQALKLAKGTTGPVLTTVAAQNDTTEEMKTADLSRVSSTGADAPVTVEEQPAAAAVSGTTQAGEAASPSLQIAGNPPPAATPNPPAQAEAAAVSTPAAPVQRTARRTLPQTASGLPWMALAGAGSLALGCWLRRRSRA